MKTKIGKIAKRKLEASTELAMRFNEANFTTIIISDASILIYNQQVDMQGNDITPWYITSSKFYAFCCFLSGKEINLGRA